MESVCKTISEVYIRGLQSSTPAGTMGREMCLGGEQRFGRGLLTWPEAVLGQKRF